jgi:hypothetical protein
MAPYDENPPDRVLDADDIVFLDFGPIFADWEADFGRTYVLGDDPVKHRLAEDLPRIWEAGRAHFAAHPDITGAQLFSHVTGLIGDAGWGHAMPDTWSASSRTCGSTAMSSRVTSRLPMTTPCDGPTPLGRTAIGSSRSTSSTDSAASAGSSNSSSISLPREQYPRREDQDQHQPEDQVLVLRRIPHSGDVVSDETV